jgi:TolB-like protein/Tfp pilus assembly protein PilF
MSIISELSRRNVIRVAVAYLAGAWLLIQVLETLFPIFGLAETSIRVVVVLLAIGFVPAMVIAWVFQLTPDGLKLDSDVDHSIPDTSARKLDRAIIVVLTLAVGYFAVDKFVFDPARDAAEVRAAKEQGRSDAVIGAFGDKSIIVLPFLNLSDDTDQEYFSDGLTEEILNLLARIPELRVISRSTAFTFKGKDIAVPEVAKKVNVAHVLEGSVRKSGNKIRVTAQLIDGRSDAHRWSQNYDREFGDIFDIQDDIAVRVVAELKLRLLGQDITTRRVDPHAYDLYLQAHFILNSLDDSKLDQAESLLLQVLAIEPEFPAAISELARAYHQLRSNRSDLRDHYTAKRDEMIDRLLALDPDSADANTWLAVLNFWGGGDAQAAAQYMEAAIAADPTDQRALRVGTFLLGELGRTDEAISVGKYILRRDPACASCVAALSSAYRNSGRYAEAVETMEPILEWRPPDSQFRWAFGVALLFAGEPERALEWFDPDPDGGHGVGYLAALYDAGRLEEFERRLAADDPSDPLNWEALARVHAWIGDNDKAFEYMEKVVVSGHFAAGDLDTDFYRRLEDDPRWAEFRSRHGVEERDLSQIEFNPALPDEILRSMQD